MKQAGSIVPQQAPQPNAGLADQGKKAGESGSAAPAEGEQAPK
jgi:hypothetical protein